MNWLSQDVEQLVERASGPLAQRQMDAIVIGSGYGGSVAALRLAQAGQRVALLERGDEFIAGEFPNDISQAGKHVRAEVAAAEGVASMGYENALFDFRLGLRAGALVGNGLGGGSLINAAVGWRPDPRVFQQPAWPAALRQEDLTPWFDKAQAMLEVRRPGRAAPPVAADTENPEYDLRATPKYQRLEQLAQAAAAAARRSDSDRHVEVGIDEAPLAIQMRGTPSQALGPRSNCIGCGDCVTGCNHDAKLSLTKTYLPAAYEAGAELFTGVTVLTVMYEPTMTREFPWVVSFVRTRERQLRQDIAAASRNGTGGNEQWIYRLRARTVVLAAGTFGSTEIMLRSRAKGLSLSPTALGMRVSGNGDDVSFAYNLKEEAHAVGWGSQPLPVKPPVGPTIAGVIRFHDPADVKRGTLVQDGAAPGLIRGLFHELLTTLGAVQQLDRWRFDVRDGGDALALKKNAVARSMTLLGMGHDTAGAMIVYDSQRDRVGWGWPEPAGETTPGLHKQRMSAVGNLGGIHVQNPAVSVLPESVAAMLTGPQPGGGMFTVHPLGGCRMADSVLEGVVNHWGAAYRSDGSLHEGLFVLDGSVMPASLGANPMLTITALAERACAAIVTGLASRAEPARRPLPDHPPRRCPLQIPEPAPAGATLSEVLRGPLTLHADLGALHRGSQVRAALFVQMRVDDWQALQDDPLHRVPVPLAASPRDYTATRLVLHDGRGLNQDLVLQMQGVGSVQLFYREREGWLARGDRLLRLALTYLLGRWLPDHIKGRRARNNPPRSLAQWCDFIISAGKSLVHATEVRAFKYSVALTDGTRSYQLSGMKRVNAAAGWPALKAWWGEFGRGRWPAPRRRTLWEQLTEIDVELRTDDRLVLSGRLRMDLQDVMRNMVPQLGAPADTLRALQAFAGYPLLMLRAFVKTRLLDFRAPDYRTLPDTDPALIPRPPGAFELDLPENRFASLSTRVDGKPAKIEPEGAMRLDVRLGHRSDEKETVRIGLIRYKQPRIAWNRDENTGATKARAIILINGFAQSTRAFVAPELGDKCLAAMFYEQGWDVWLLEYRVSPLLDASARYSTMDDIAAFDIPAAVARVAETVGNEIGRDPQLTQVFAFSHCVGSASLAMSILGGWLKLPGPQPAGAPEGPQANRLAGVLFSQFLPFSVGSESSQQRLQLASFLRNTLKMEKLDFTAGTVKADLVHALLDRVFSTFPYPASELCPHEGDLRNFQPDSTTCKRMAGLLSRLFSHDQLLDETHKNLDWYFGRTNLGVFLHGAKCVEYERLVNAEGHNAYVNDARIERRLTMPLMLLHGARNVLFDKESLRQTEDQFTRVFGAAMPSGPAALQRVTSLLVPGHAHFDCTIGKRAPKMVFPPVLDFFERCFTQAIPVEPGIGRCRARLPMTGPIAGWTRPDDKGNAIVRAWIELDTSTSDRPEAAVTFVRYQLEGVPRAQAQIWKCRTQTLSAGDALDLASPGELTGRNMYYCCAVADVVIPMGATDVVVHMFGVHLYKSAPLATPGADQSAQGSTPALYPPHWGLPLTMEEVGTGSEPFLLAESSVRMAVPGRPADRSATAQPVAERAQNPAMTEPQAAVGPSAPLAPLTFPDRLNDVWPADEQLGPDEAGAMLTVLKASLAHDETIARRAEPDTLSRQTRQIRSMSECELRPMQAQLWDTAGGRLQFVAAGCRHPGITAMEAQRADQSLRELAQQPETCQASFMFMLGDQIYADARAGVFDSASVIERLLPRYRTAFGSPAFRQVAARLPLYMAADDHEIHDGWSRDHIEAGSEQRSLAENARVLFRSFQRTHGPDNLAPDGYYGGSENNYIFSRAGYPFFVLDSRFWRTLRPRPRLLHPDAWASLERWLLAEQAEGRHPKFIVSGSVFAPGLVDSSGTPPARGGDTWQEFPHERSRLMTFICEHKIDNVVFLSSDYHCSAVAEISWGESPGAKAWAIVAPPLHAPLRFANAEPAQLLRDERIPLANGQEARVQLTGHGLEGEGWLHCAIAQAPGGWNMTLDYRLRQIDSGRPVGSRHGIFMPG